MKYTLKQVEVFLSIAQLGSISKAAAALNLSQSATSAALQELENRYGVQLFERSGKRLKLNVLGHTMRVKAQALLNEASQFEQSLQGQKDSGDLRVGASLTIGNYLAVGYLAHYLQKFPDANVNLQVASTPEIIAKLLNCELDVALVEADVHHPELNVDYWRDDRMLVVCSAGHPLANKERLTDKDCLSAKWILREPESGARQTFDRAMQGILPQLNIILELRHNEAIKSAVKSGLGMGCLSEIAIAEELARGSLIALPLSDRSMHRRFYFVTHKTLAVTDAAKEWIALCRG